MEFLLGANDSRVSLPSLQVSGKAVLITGCDSGFGHALAKHLHGLGLTVFAGCLLKVRLKHNPISLTRKFTMVRGQRGPGSDPWLLFSTL